MNTTLQATGFWLDRGAAGSVDWCEPNYVHSHYVAEWWNTLSSLPLVILGIYGLVRVLRARGVEPRFAVAFAAMTLVGVGSTAFHGTLLKSAQALDELPMIYCGLTFVYLIVNRQLETRHHRIWQLGLGLYAALFTVVYLTFQAYFVFFIWSYAAIITALVLLSARLAFGPEGSAMHRWLFGISAGSYVGGVALLWMPEHVLLACDHPAQALELHALFHITSLIGTYMWILFAMWDRFTRAGAAPRVDRKHVAPFVIGAFAVFICACATPTAHEPTSKADVRVTLDVGAASDLAPYGPDLPEPEDVPVPDTVPVPDIARPAPDPGPEPIPCTPKRDTYTVDYVTLVEMAQQTCGGTKCHIGGDSAGLALDAADFYANTVGVPSKNSPLLRIHPGLPNKSYLFLKLTGQGTFNQMPIGKPPLDDATITLFREWIEDCAAENAEKGAPTQPR